MKSRNTLVTHSIFNFIDNHRDKKWLTNTRYKLLPLVSLTSRSLLDRSEHSNPGAAADGVLLSQPPFSPLPRPPPFLQQMDRVFIKRFSARDHQSSAQRTRHCPFSLAQRSGVICDAKKVLYFSLLYNITRVRFRFGRDPRTRVREIRLAFSSSIFFFRFFSSSALLFFGFTFFFAFRSRQFIVSQSFRRFAPLPCACPHLLEPPIANGTSGPAGRSRDLPKFSTTIEKRKQNEPRGTLVSRSTSNDVQLCCECIPAPDVPRRSNVPIEGRSTSVCSP